MSSSQTKHLAFSYFSYAQRLLLPLLEMCPPFLRQLFFKATFAEFGKRSFIDYRCYFRYPSKIKIGSNVSINTGCKFYPSRQFKDVYITLEDDVVLGPNVTFFGAGQDPRTADLPDVAAPIHVCRGAYIGGNSTIRYGVRIGAGAVIGAGSLVTKDIPGNVIAGGVPARIIKQRYDSQ
ncbi:MAG: acyltransferase [Ilumatobacteraceae bacterium]